ncbi:MAG: hypothetical protein EA374_03660 [Acholeplasmatales bacterium]|nr:MAG: hypothetical protein EA374_03660 [Acholeplasmatales bacterium]
MKRFWMGWLILGMIAVLSACDSRPPGDSWDLEQLLIEIQDAYEVPAGLYTIEYTIENLNDYVREFGVSVKVEAFDADDNPVTLDGTTFEALAGAVYTVTVTVLKDDESVLTTRTMTVQVAEAPVEMVRVTFDPANGTAAYEVQVPVGSPVATPDEPLYEDHTFIGWSVLDERDKLWDFTDDVMADLTLVALWQGAPIVVYLLSYYLNDGTTTLYLSEGNTTGLLALPSDDPVREGYRFTGWAYDPSGKAPALSGDPIEQAMSLYAQWEEIVYVMVEFARNDGSGDAFSVVLEKGDILTEEAAPLREGYLFLGWSKAADSDAFWMFATEPVEANMTLYARWAQETSGTTFTVTFDLQVDDLPPVENQTVIEGALATYPLPDPMRVDYHFIGWFLDPDMTDIFLFDDMPITADITLYAGWQSMFGTVYTINYWVNDGSGDLFTSDNVSEGTLYVIGQIPTQSGYVFTGWYLDAATTMPAEHVFVEDDLDLYAGWRAEATPLSAPSGLNIEDGILTFVVVSDEAPLAFDIFINDDWVLQVNEPWADVSSWLIEAGVYGIELVAVGDGIETLDSPRSAILLVTIEAEDDSDQGYFVYENDEGYLRLLGLTEDGKDHVKATGSLIIPNTIDGIPVYAIDFYAFFSLSWELGEDLGLDPEDWSDENNWNRALFVFDKVVIPSNVNYIWDNAFTGNQIKSLTIGINVERIDYGAFKGVGQLEHLTIPGSVHYIGVEAFAEMPNLKTVDIREGVQYIDDRAFQYNERLETVIFADSITYIGDGTFVMTPLLGDIHLPVSLQYLGLSAFKHSGMSTVTIPAGLEEIGDFALSGEGLTYITVHADNPSYMALDGVLFNKNLSRLIQYPLGNTNKTYAIPNGVDTIAWFAFNEAAYLEIISVPASVTSIETFAFFGIMSLSTIEFKGTVPPSIGSRALMYETGMSEYEPLPNMTILVPSGYLDVYKLAPGFSFYEDHLTSQ